MENAYHDLILNTTAPACYIERGQSIKSLNRLVINGWLKAVNPGLSNTPQSYFEYITMEVLRANDDDRTWTAIRSSGHIWCNSIFEVPESAALFVQLGERAIAQGLRNKIIFDCVERRLAMHYLTYFQPGARKLMTKLQEEHSVYFCFWEEILKMLGQRPALVNPPPNE